MAYQTGTASSIEDLVEKLKIFAAGLGTTPWTVDEWDPTNNQCTLHRGSCYVSFWWAESGTALGIYQSLGFINTSTLAYNQTDDSGNGATSTPITTGRRVNFTNGTGGGGSVNAGPYTAYHFFAGEGSTPYIYIVVEMSTGVYRHFGFGNLVKASDFTGGEFVYGHVWATDTNADAPSANAQCFLLDGLGNVPADQATMHLEGLPGQAVGSKWGVFYNTTTSIGNDRAGNARLQLFGGARGGLYGYSLAWMRASQLAAHKLMIPVVAMLRSTAASPHTWRYLGEMPDVRLLNIHFFNPGDEITVGADTYVVFPWVRKQYLVSNTEESWNAGVAYKKVV